MSGPWLYDDSEDLKDNEKKFGEITKVEITNYWKFKFTLRVKTAKNYELDVCTGGNSDDIYKYDPFGDWEEHEIAGIAWINILKDPNKEN